MYMILVQPDLLAHWIKCKRRIEIMNEQKTCWNCLHEYQCDWSSAGDHHYCKDWVEEYQEGDKKCEK